MNKSAAISRHSPIRVVVAEDSPTQAAWLEHALSERGCRVTVTRDGEAAMEAVRDEPPTLLVSDIVMPKMDGYQLCRAVKSDPATADVLVMLATTLADPSDAVRGLAAGADDFLTKPYDAELLFSRIDRMLSGHARASAVAANGPTLVTFRGEDFAIEGDARRGIRFMLSAVEETDKRNRMLAEKNAELERASAELAEANRAKSEFLASMSHELRTPLNSVIGFSGVMLQGMSGSLTEEQMRQVTMIHDSGHHLLSLINDVLDLSRIEAGRTDLHVEKLLVGDVVAHVVETIRPMADLKGLRLVYEIADDCADVVTDLRSIQQIILNLLSNAVKFTDSGGIDLSVRCGDGEMRFAVADTGIGVSANQLEGVFEEFQQYEQAGHAKAEGTGLGLSVSKKLADSLGGHIDAESVAGEGSVFTLVLPVRR